LDFIEACRKFIEFDTTPAGGTAEIARYAADLCRAAGLNVEIQEETVGGIEQANIIARPSAAAPESELLMQTHLDTSDAGAFALWTKTGANPYNASIYSESVVGETIYGLGAASAKLDFLCKLRAISNVLARNPIWRIPPVLVATFGEETGMQGAVKLIRKKKIAATMAVVGEPTSLQLVGAGKGFAAVEIEIPFSEGEKEYRAQHDLSDGSTTQSRIFTGKSANSSNPEVGESAILKMLEYLTRLPEGLIIMEMEGGQSFNTIPGQAVLEIDVVAGLRDTISTKIARILKTVSSVETKFRDYPDPAFEPPQPTLNIGSVRTYEESVLFAGCCRLPPSVSHEVYEKWMDDLRVVCKENGAVFRITDYKQPFRTPSDHRLVKECQAVLREQGLPDVYGTQSVTNEANVFNRFGIACVVIGPGQGVGNSHAPNEYVTISQLNAASAFYEGVLERICL
jgi:acetylornithine deacetylase/succinyl-diaminopimelate desuccinylase-like protein